MSGILGNNASSMSSNIGSNTKTYGGVNGSSQFPKSTVSGNSTVRLLKDIYDSASSLPKNDDFDLGYIHLTLNQLKNKSNQLRKQQDGESSNFTKAHYLLAPSGISAEDIEQELDSMKLPVSTYDVSSSRIAAAPGNMDGYFNARKDENILATIEQSLSSASRDFSKFINESITIDWKARKDDLRKSFGIGKSPSGSKDEQKSNVHQILWNSSLPGNYNILTPLPVPKINNSLKSLTRETFEKYSTIIYQLNEARLDKKFFPLASSFEELNKSGSDLKSKQLYDVWKAIVMLTDEQSAKLNQEQQFYDLYETKDFEKSTRFKKKLIKSSKKCLEEQFYSYMDEIYLKDDKKEEFLPPSNINKVSFFIKKIITENNSKILEQTLNVNGTPIWALIFYLLRAGLRKDVLILINEYQDLFTKFDKNFPTYLKKYIESDCIELSPELSDRMNMEFNQQFSFLNNSSLAGFDAYKYTVYKIVGKCDLSKKNLPSEINLSMEDWLWFHLSIINEFNSDMSISSNLIFENYTLHNLQKKIVTLGARKFNSSSNNPLYLKTLIMVGLFELAVQYTFENLSEYDAVHLAIGLCYHGLLKVSVSTSRDELITLNSSDEYQINFSRLLGSYTRFFKVSDPKVACQYLILIAMGKGGSSEKEIEKCHEALRELILISREFGMLLGELNQQNGVKVPGLLEKQRSLIGLTSVDSFYRKIVEVSAVRCEEEGRIFDALLLYQLCQEFDTVISLINRLLGELLSSTELDKPLIDFGNYENITGNEVASNTIDNNIILLSQHIMKTFNNNSSILSKIDSSKKNTCDLLLQVVEARDIFVSKNWRGVIASVKKLELLPIDIQCDLVEIRRLADLSMSSMDENIIKVIPSILIIVMTSISQLNYSILSKHFSVSSAEKDELNNLRIIAKNCMIYAGIVQYKMPRETYSLLIKLESSL